MQEALTVLPAPPAPAWHSPSPPGATPRASPAPCGHQSPGRPCPWAVPPGPGAAAVSVVSALLAKRRPLWKPPDFPQCVA